jgi:CRP-like cAMP-binding protein
MDVLSTGSSTEAIQAAFASNRLLATLDEGDRALLQPHMALISFAVGDQVLGAGAPVDSSLFPVDGLMVSMIVRLNGGRSIEVTSIGKEGAVGGIISCGAAPAFSDALVQIAGQGLMIPLRALERAKQASSRLANLFCRYSDFLLSQVMQTVACNSFHPIEARAARWLLLAQDRAGTHRIALTQEALAGLLGVQRTTVNAVAQLLQEQGFIVNRRGAIEVRDRDGLMGAACECYAAVEQHFKDVIADEGAAWAS